MTAKSIVINYRRHKLLLHYQTLLWSHATVSSKYRFSSPCHCNKHIIIFPIAISEKRLRQLSVNWWRNVSMKWYIRSNFDHQLHRMEIRCLAFTFVVILFHVKHSHQGIGKYQCAIVSLVMTMNLNKPFLYVDISTTLYTLSIVSLFHVVYVVRKIFNKLCMFNWSKHISVLALG